MRIPIYCEHCGGLIATCDTAEDTSAEWAEAPCGENVCEKCCVECAKQFDPYHTCVFRMIQTLSVEKPYSKRWMIGFAISLNGSIRADTAEDSRGQELMTFANKRLCSRAAKRTQEVARMMCKAAEKAMPELLGNLVPMRVYHGVVCHEMEGCGRCTRE